MKILFITQKIDTNDDLLGFIHGWIGKLAGKVEKINAIALWVGKYDLPQNVLVHSLGKERFINPDDSEDRWLRRLTYSLRFYRLIWRLRKDYDLVFVHMNIEYVLLAGLLWRLLGKKIVLWYAHYQVSPKLRLAALLSNRVVTSAPLACGLKTKKLRVLQQGVDIEKFVPQNIESLENLKNLLFLGRISAAKNVDTLIDSFSELRKNNPDVNLDIVGTTVPGKEGYLEKIKEQIKRLGLENAVRFLGKVPFEVTPEAYRRHGIFINLTTSGSFDKTTLEAMSCGLIIFVSNKVFEGILPPDLQKILMFGERDAKELARKISALLQMPQEKLIEIKKQMREIIVEQQSLDGLIEKLIKNFEDLHHE